MMLEVKSLFHNERSISFRRGKDKADLFIYLCAFNLHGTGVEAFFCCARSCLNLFEFEVGNSISQELIKTLKTHNATFAN
jgi:hypothetical protein